MIRIPLNNKSLSDLVQVHYDALLEKPYYITDRITDWLHKLKDPDTKAFIKILKDSLETILKGEPNALEGFINTNHQKYRIILKSKEDTKERKKELRRFIGAINDIFNYDRFSNKKKGWGAYSFVASLDVPVCLYCNKNSIITFNTTEGKSRSRIDHWFPQFEYPYFGISFYNLIPSCHICNSDGKRTKSFLLSTHVNPYIEGYEDSLLFSARISKNTYAQKVESSICIDFKHGEGFTETDDIVVRARRNTMELLLKDFYTAHINIAAKIIDDKRKYDKAYIETLEDFSSTNGFKIWDSDEIKNAILQKTLVRLKDSYTSQYNIDRKDFHKNPLSKFIRDIAKEVELI